jgi:glycosyltransferase involved in cell wall biosynthesis
MADASLSLLGDDALWKTFSAGARHGAEKFSADTVVSQYEDFYKEVLGR